MSIRQTILPFKLESSEKRLNATAYAGIPLVIEFMRTLFNVSHYQALGDALGYKRWKTVRRHLESLVALVAAGGEHVDDLRWAKRDPGLEQLLGFELSSPTQAKDFLYRFHQKATGEPLTGEDDETLSRRGKARIREEGPGLRVLGDFVGKTVRCVQRKRRRSRATLDVDATIIEAHKKGALRAYDGRRGYQPQMAYWAENGVWVLDQFRDGNVPAEYSAKEFLEQAFGSLPKGVKCRRLRADSALYIEDALSWVADNDIEFVVTAMMSQGLLERAKGLDEKEWRRYRTVGEKGMEESSVVREWAEVADYVPGWKRNYHKEGEAFRYVVVRVRSRQEELFEAKEAGWRYYGVVTNMKWEGGRLLRYHREKQGTVERGHSVMKHDLGGGVLPCGRFGANAAWWRLNVLVHNLLELLKEVGLPEEFGSTRPKGLRLRLLNLAGIVVHRGRQVILRLKQGYELYARTREAIMMWYRYDTS